MKILAGDIGATNSRLAIFDEAGTSLITYRVYASSEHSSLDEIVRKFLYASSLDCDKACFGLPGPITSDERIVLTNLPWHVDRTRLMDTLKSDKLALINDVEASALGILKLSKNDLLPLNAGRAEAHGNRAIISIGTGLGVAGLGPDGRAFATEAGHADFSPSEDFDIEFYRRLRADHGHVSWERVASGPALVDILEEVARQRSRPVPSLSPAAKSPAAIVDAAHDGSNQLCVGALEIFQRYVGSAAGNITLGLLATGGVYFTGGVAPKIIGGAGAKRILSAFFDKGRMRPLLERVPVNLVLTDKIALNGAARRALLL